jgi:phosphatidylinositol kinase/protein kinase (PI-3  family)
MNELCNRFWNDLLLEQDDYCNICIVYINCNCRSVNPFLTLKSIIIIIIITTIMISIHTRIYQPWPEWLRDIPPPGEDAPPR